VRSPHKAAGFATAAIPSKYLAPTALLITWQQAMTTVDVQIIAAIGEATGC